MPPFSFFSFDKIGIQATLLLQGAKKGDSHDLRI
jgi:hypothetical protein